ncbi:MAG: TonB-dependent receptor, partial [Gemmatimonadota bacterium]
EALERIEIVKGSGQIMNGPQTVGGVINFVTRRPPSEGTHGALTFGGGTADYRNAHLWLGTGRDGRGISLDYAFREGAGVRLEHGHRFHNAILNGTLPISGNQSVVVKGALWDESSRISETGLTQEEFEADPFSLPFSAAGRFDVRRYLGQAVHEIRSGGARLQTNVYASNTNRASWRQSGESEERLGEDEYAEDFNCSPGAISYVECGNQGRPREYTVLGIEPRLSVDLDGDGNSSLDVGGRLYSEDVRRRQFVGDTPTSRMPDAELTRDNEIDTRVIAGYAQARLSFGSAAVSPGVRLERLAQDIRNRFPGREAEAQQSYTQFLPGVGATYGIGERATLFAGMHRGFAPPRPADIYQPEPGQPIVLVDPETSWNSELGLRLDPRPGISLEATLFRMDFGNQIIEAPAGEGQRFINGGETLNQGLEAGAVLSLGTLRGTADDLLLSGSYTYLPTARFEGGDGRGAEVAGNRLPYAPRHVVSAAASFAHRSGVTLGASAEHTGRQFADDENTVSPSDDGQDGILPAYTVTNAFSSYAIPGTRVQIRASVRNLFDEVYITQRNEGIYTGMRRLVRTELEWSF